MEGRSGRARSSLKGGVDGPVGQRGPGKEIPAYRIFFECDVCMYCTVVGAHPNCLDDLQYVPTLCISSSLDNITSELIDLAGSQDYNIST